MNNDLSNTPPDLVDDYTCIEVNGYFVFFRVVMPLGGSQ